MNPLLQKLSKKLYRTKMSYRVTIGLYRCVGLYILLINRSTMKDIEFNIKKRNKTVYQYYCILLSSKSTIANIFYNKIVYIYVHSINSFRYDPVNA